MCALKKKIKYSIKYEHGKIFESHSAIGSYYTRLNRASCIEIPLEERVVSLFARNCRAKLSMQNKHGRIAVSYSSMAKYRGSSIAIIHAGTIYFYLGRKSPVVMEIYRGLNIDISARQRRCEMSLNRNLESLCAYQKYIRIEKYDID